MIRMILADDEPVITRGIQRLLDWKALGIEITGEYEDGKRAFEAIVRERPDIALLDISMPEMSGVEILKECRAMGIGTAVTFISGFQDFEYAKAALEYGAVAYLLKPVIREELLGAVEKSIRAVGGESTVVREVREEYGADARIDYGRLMEDGTFCYVPVCADVVYRCDEDGQMRRLLRFSLLSFLEEHLSRSGQGIVFQKNDNIVIILKAADCDMRGVVEELWAKSVKATGHTTFYIIGDAVGTMGEIPGMFQRCLERYGFLFFADKMLVPVIDLHEKVFPGKADSEMLGELRQRLFDATFTQNEAQMAAYGRQYARAVLRISDGRKEDACFYFCTAVRFMEERCRALDLPGRKPEMKGLLEKGRACANFTEMEALFGGEFAQYAALFRTTAVNSDKRDILKAKAYIEEHYMDNLSLNVLAEEIHMNPYYFSRFFKKNTGENFKDYVNRVRIEHAMPMLLSSDMKTYEIAERVGFGDIRMFNAAFQKLYQETPVSYRKRVRE